ncbi:MAG: DnaA regulatory inactivator HdaA [Agrobacterium vaccinii]
MSENNKTGGVRPKAEQLPLAFSHQTATGRDDLLVAAPLHAAVSIVDEWPRWPSPVVILVGPQGSGKSHLASIWKNTSNAVAIIPFKDAGAARLAEHGAVLFEDADRNGFNDTELFHVINSVRENGTSLLITTREWPAAWPVTLPDLRSRLKAATVVEIGEPDEDLLGQVLMKLFADRQLYMDDKLVSYIVARMERSLNMAQTIVERLDRLGLSRGTRIRRTMAAEVLTELGGNVDED